MTGLGTGNISKDDVARARYLAEMDNCRYCGLHIECIPHPGIGDVWVVMWTETTADGLSYCPPNPDHRGRFHNHVPRKL